MSKKFLYLFKEGHDAFGGDQTTMKNILGGKGAGLAEMTHAGIIPRFLPSQPSGFARRAAFLLVSGRGTGFLLYRKGKAL